MTDPDMECVMIPAVVPDAGATPDAQAGDAAPSDAASDAAPSDAATEAGPVVADASSDGAAGEGGAATDAAVTQFNEPDSGIVTKASVCAGSCNGSRACSYPTTTTSCGTSFCNTSTQQGGFACDGTGRCSAAVQDCGNYSCESVVDAGAASEGQCASGCTSQSDCSDTGFCDGQKCQPKLGDGLPCTNGNNCQSTFCVTNGPSSVCCDQACDSTMGDPNYIPGATCSGSGYVGKCTCTQCAGIPGASCVLWYKDVDGDGQGDVNGSINAGTAAVHCSTETVATNWSLNNTDCDDDDPNVYLGSTVWATTPSHGTATWDYNCDKVIETEYPYIAGGTCEVCGGSSCTATTTCGSNDTTSQGAFNCHTSALPYCTYRFLETTTLSVTTKVQSAPLKTTTTPDLVPVEPIEPIRADPLFELLPLDHGGVHELRRRHQRARRAVRRLRVPLHLRNVQRRDVPVVHRPVHQAGLPVAVTAPWRPALRAGR